MRRNGSAAKIVLLIAGVVLIGAGAFGYWWWSGQQDPAEVQIVEDATGAVATYLTEQPHPQFGNLDRISGAGFDHTRYGTPEKRVLRAARLAHYTNGFTGANATMELIILVLPPDDGTSTSQAAVKSRLDDGRTFIVTHPKWRG